MSALLGMQIITSPYLTIQREDWSLVRSPSRAARRRRQGHRQNVRHLTVPNPNAFVMEGKIFMHPETYAAFLIANPDLAGSMLNPRGAFS